MHQWTESASEQVMACHLFGAKLLPEPMLAYCQLDSKFQWNLNWKPIIFIQENAFEIVVCQNDAVVKGRQQYKYPVILQCFYKHCLCDNLCTVCWIVTNAKICSINPHPRSITRGVILLCGYIPGCLEYDYTTHYPGTTADDPCQILEDRIS